MQLVRFVIAQFNPLASEVVWPPADVDAIHVDASAVANHGDPSLPSTGGQVLFRGRTLIERPPRSAEGVVALPLADMRRIERGLEAVIEMQAVGLRARRTIISPHPAFALAAENDEDFDWLKESVAAVPGALRFRHDGDLETERAPLSAQSISALVDRIDGVRLLAEAIAQSHATGRFHALVRVFEHAFRIGGRGLIAPLSTFLGGTFLGYAHAEVEQWVDVRDASIHADLRRQQRIACEPDVLPVLARAEQAAYDVLHNKREWGTASTERRDCWTPGSGVLTNDGCTRFAIVGNRPSLPLRVFDQFGSYLTDPGGPRVSGLPETWWAPLPRGNTGETCLLHGLPSGTTLMTLSTVPAAPG